MKYVALNVKMGDVTRQFVVAFPDAMVHALVGQSLLTAARRQWPSAEVNLASAGDISCVAHATGGSSESLKLQGSEDAARYFNNQDYGGNIL